MRCGSASASVSPSTWTRRNDAGMRAWSSAVRVGSSRNGSSAGSPTGADPSGSSSAARCPCIRYALTSAIAAATPPSSSGSGAATTGWSSGTRGAVAVGGGSATRRRLGDGSAGAGAVRGAGAVAVGGPGRGADSRQGAKNRGLAAFEERAPLGGNGFGVLEVLVEEQTRVTGIEAVDVMHGYDLFCSTPHVPPATAPGGGTGDRSPSRHNGQHHRGRDPHRRDSRLG